MCSEIRPLSGLPSKTPWIYDAFASHSIDALLEPELIQYQRAVTTFVLDKHNLQMRGPGLILSKPPLPTHDLGGDYQKQVLSRTCMTHFEG